VLKVTPLGRVPDSLKVGVGVPLSVTVKLPAVPAVNLALAALVIVGATVSRASYSSVFNCPVLSISTVTGIHPYLITVGRISTLVV